MIRQTKLLDGSVDSKLSCPVFVAHDLSGVIRSLVFSRAPKFFRAQLVEELRSVGRPIHGSGCDGLRESHPARSSAHPADTVPSIVGHETPPTCHSDGRGPARWPSHNGTGADRAESADAGPDSAPYCRWRRRGPPAHTAHRPDWLPPRAQTRCRVLQWGPQIAGSRPGRIGYGATHWPPPSP